MKVYLVFRKRFGVDDVIHVCSDAGDANDKLVLAKKQDRGLATVFWVMDRELEEPLSYYRVDVMLVAGGVRYSPTKISTCSAKLYTFIRDRYLNNCDGYMYVRAANDSDAVRDAIDVMKLYVEYGEGM